MSVGRARRLAGHPGRMGLFALAVAAAPAALPAQTIEVGAGIARGGSPPRALADDGCAVLTAWAGEGRGGLRFSRAASLEGTVAYHFASGETCGPSRAPAPPTGPFEVTDRARPGSGYPFFTSDLRLAFEPSSPSGPIWLRAFGGYGRMWGPDVGYWLAGGGLVFGGQLEAVLDFEWNWFDVPFDDILRMYEDGVLISESTTSGETSHTQFRIKAGVRWRP